MTVIEGEGEDDPDVNIFGGHTNFLEAFSNTTIILGDLSFDENSPWIIR